MIRAIKQVLALLSRRERRNLLLLSFGMIGMGFFELVGVGSIMPFISVASNPQRIHTNEYLSWAYNAFGFSSERQFLVALGLSVVVFLLVSNASRALVSWGIKRYSSMRLHSIASRLLHQYLGRPYVYFLNQNTSTLAKNVLNEVGAVVKKFLLPSIEFVSRAVIALSILILLFVVDPTLSLIVAGVLSLAYATVFLGVRRTLIRVGARRSVANSDRYKYATEAMGGIKDIKLLGSEKSFLRRFQKPSKEFARAEATSDIIGELPKYLLETIAFGGVLLIVLYQIRASRNFDEVLPIVSLYAFAGYRLMPALQVIFRAVTKMRYSVPLVETLYNDLTGWENDYQTISSQLHSPLPFRRSITLDDVVFTYPGVSDPVIKKQSLVINKNTSVGFVGPTGCGKTTMVDIILGLLEPHDGRIIVDETPIEDSNRRNWQANLGYVPQHIYLTDDTIAANIAFGVPSEDIDHRAVERASRIANLHHFVTGELQAGYETIVGERGVRLSGGQRQRIGIARALYKNPDTIIMDEATSALDNLTEQTIMEAIHTLNHKKTILLIAHRLTTVRECDVIFVMDHGKIVDSGSYDELLGRNDRFRRLAEGR